MNDNNQSKQEAQNTNWRDTIRQAAETAEKYATDVANDYTRDWTEAKQEDREDAARNAEAAFAHAKGWYTTARLLREAAEEAKNPDDDKAARKVREAIQKATDNPDQSDWCCPITEELHKAAQEALREAGKRAAGFAGACEAAEAAADLAATYAETVAWG